MDEYLCLTVRSRPGEPAAEFRGRLSEFWTRMLRERPADFARVYAEAAAFEVAGDRLERRYLVEAAAADVLAPELAAAEMEAAPLDRDDVYSKYEAAPPEWVWIEH